MHDCLLVLPGAKRATLDAGGHTNVFKVSPRVSIEITSDTSLCPSTPSTLNIDQTSFRLCKKQRWCHRGVVLAL